MNMEKQVLRIEEMEDPTNFSREEIEETIEENAELAKRTLAGKIPAKKILNKGAIRDICITAWGEAAEVKVFDMGPNIFLFNFRNEETTKNIMFKSPWAVMNHILSLQRWDPEKVISEIDFTFIPIWVQIHGLPFGAMMVTNTSKIMKLVGEVLEIEDPMVKGVLLRSFMRVRVNLNSQKALPTGCWVPRKNQPKSWIMFRYEKLQGFCYGCGVLGHEQKDCQKEVVMTAICNEIPLYG